MKRFRDKYSFEQRTETSVKMLNEYPNRIPVICEPAPVNTNLDLRKYTKTKYLVPREVTMGKFILEIRKQIDLLPEIAIFLFVNDALPPTSALIGSVYDRYKDKDGFLYITFTGENTFG